MGNENILAIKVGPEQTMGSTVDTGLRAVLAVTFINADIQSYTVYGNSLYMIHYDVGQLDCFQAFSFFCKQFYNQPKEWHQLAAPPPNPLMTSSQIYLIAQPPPPDPIAVGIMTLLDSGYDPLKGYWLQFAGNYDLTCPLFPQFSGVNRNIPNYQIRQN
jgi:hypothetical protein